MRRFTLIFSSDFFELMSENRIYSLDDFARPDSYLMGIRKAGKSRKLAQYTLFKV